MWWARGQIKPRRTSHGWLKVGFFGQDGLAALTKVVLSRWFVSACVTRSFLCKTKITEFPFLCVQIIFRSQKNSVFNFYLFLIL